MAKRVKRDYEAERANAREYVVRVHRGQIEPEVRAQLERIGITPQDLPEADEVVAVWAARDGLAMSHAVAVTTLRANGQTMRYYEQLADGTERELFHGA